MSNTKAFNNPICFHCLKETENLIKIEIPALQYGSGFDEFGTKMYFCEKCLKEINPEWYPLKIVTKIEKFDNNEISIEKYYKEEEIFDFINNSDIRIRELFYNSYAKLPGYLSMPAQTYIDYHLGILPHNECKKYGLLSQDELLTYKEKYPICANVFNVEIDNVKFSSCPFSETGQENGKIKENNFGTQCYNCTCFKEKDKDFKYKTIKYEDLKDYSLYMKVKIDERFKRFNNIK